MTTYNKQDVSYSHAKPTSKAELDASKLSYHLATARGRTNVSHSGYTDYMLICNWDEVTGWESPVVQPFGPLSLLPSANILQYATGCFEGVKAYRGYDGQLRLFRLRLNCGRMPKSSLRVGLPQFDPGALEQLIHSFVALEAEHWLPKDRVGQTLYLRPTHIGTTPGLGLQKPRQSSLYLIATLTPGFSTNGGMTLVTSPPDTIRAWPGGFGNAKLSANYGPTLSAHADVIA